MVCVWGNLAVHPAAFQPWTADNFKLTGPFLSISIIQSFQHLLVMDMGSSAPIHFEILKNKVKPSDLSLEFVGGLTWEVLVAGPCLSGEI